MFTLPWDVHSCTTSRSLSSSKETFLAMYISEQHLQLNEKGTGTHACIKIIKKWKTDMLSTSLHFELTTSTTDYKETIKFSTFPFCKGSLTKLMNLSAYVTKLNSYQLDISTSTVQRPSKTSIMRLLIQRHCIINTRPAHTRQTVTTKKGYICKLLVLQILAMNHGL